MKAIRSISLAAFVSLLGTGCIKDLQPSQAPPAISTTVLGQSQPKQNQRQVGADTTSRPRPSLNCEILDFSGSSTYASPFREIIAANPGRHDIQIAIYNACVCQSSLYTKEKARESSARKRFGLAVTGAILSGSGAVATTAFGAVSGASDQPSSDLVIASTIVSGVITAAGAAIAAVAGFMPDHKTIDAESTRALGQWRNGVNALHRFLVSSSTDDLIEANAAFTSCASVVSPEIADSHDTGAAASPAGAPANPAGAPANPAGANVTRTMQPLQLLIPRGSSSSPASEL